MRNAYGKAASQSRATKGFYAATVTRVEGEDVYVKVPRLSNEFEHGPIPYVGGTPSVGDDTFVGFLENDPDTVVAVFSGGGAGSGPIQDAIFITTTEDTENLIALADYVCDGVDDHEEFIAAFDDLGEDGGTIWLGRGWYEPAQPMDMTGLGPVSIIGTGNYSYYATWIETVAYEGPGQVFYASDAGGRISFSNVYLFFDSWGTGIVPEDPGMLYFPNRRLDLSDSYVEYYGPWDDDFIETRPMIAMTGGVWSNVTTATDAVAVGHGSGRFFVRDSYIQARAQSIVSVGALHIAGAYLESYEVKPLVWSGDEATVADSYLEGYSYLEGVESGVATMSGGTVAMSDCSVYGYYYDWVNPMSFGVILDGVDNATISGCQFENADASVRVTGGPTNVVIAGNSFQYSACFVWADGTAGDKSRLLVANNVGDYGEWRSFSIGPGYEHVSVVGNSMKTHGYYSGTDMAFDGVKYLLVADNEASL